MNFDQNIDIQRMSSHDPTKNIRKGRWIGVGVGLVASALANGWLIVAANPEAGQELARVYVWILPGVGGIGVILGLVKNIKMPTTMRGFFEGFSAMTIIINVIIIGLAQQLTPFFQSIGK